MYKTPPGTGYVRYMSASHFVYRACFLSLYLPATGSRERYERLYTGIIGRLGVELFLCALGRGNSYSGVCVYRASAAAAVVSCYLGIASVFFCCVSCLSLLVKEEDG